MKNTDWSQRSAKHLSSVVLTGLLVVAMSHAAFAQETQPSDDEPPPVQQFGGVGSVPGQLADDERLTESLTDPIEEFFVRT